MVAREAFIIATIDARLGRRWPEASLCPMGSTVALQGKLEVLSGDPSQANWAGRKRAFAMC